MFYRPAITLLLIVICTLTACDKPKKKKPSKSSSGETKSTSKKPASKDPKAAAKPSVNEYKSVDEALQAMGKALQTNDSKLLTKASAWIRMQGSGTVDKLGAVLNDESEEIPIRFAAGRALVAFDNRGKAHLLKATHSENKKLRHKAIHNLAQLRPLESDLLDRFMELLDDEDDQIRIIALRAIGLMGTRAQRAGDKLLAMFQNADESNKMRDEIKKTLKKVNPRKTFND